MVRNSKYTVNEKRTRELNIRELLVVSGKGNKNQFHCILKSSKELIHCPHCGGIEIRNQGNMHRDYLDIIPRGEDVAFITVSLEFQKSKCLAENCGRVFYPRITFASPYARTTHRLEDVLVRMILLEGYSYTEISHLFQDNLSRQVVGQIFHRRVKELETDTSESSKWYRDLMAEGWHPGVWRLLNRGHHWR